MTSVLRVLPAALLAVLLAACASSDKGYRFDERLDAKVAQLVLHGGEIDLRTLVALPEGPWDKVHVFTVGATAQSVQQAVGRPVLQEPTFSHPGNLLVFTQGDRTVAAVAVGGSILPDGVWTDRARVVPLGARPPHRPAIVEPSSVIDPTSPYTPSATSAPGVPTPDAEPSPPR